MLTFLRGACVAAVLFVCAAPLQAQVLFHETFNNTPTGCDTSAGGGGPGTLAFPAGWLLRNVDNRTPAANVAYVNEAWEVREDFNFNVAECAAFSTSWYSPAGAADDWMWSPAVSLPAGSSRLSWRAVTYDPAYPDGYEVRVMVEPTTPTGGTGVIGNQITSSTQVFSTAAEQSSWVARSVELGAYAGQTIRVGFRNNSNDRFLLLIDDVRIEVVNDFDPALQVPSDVASGQYAKVPAFLGYPFDVQATVVNAGAQALTGVTVLGDILLDGVPVQDTASAPISLASGASQAVQAASGAYLEPGLWSFEAMVTATEGDQRAANSVQAVDLLEVTVDELTRANGVQAGVLGIGTGQGGELGNDFVLPAAAVLVGVHYTVDNYDADEDPQVPGSGDGVGELNGLTMQATIRAWDSGGNVPGTLLHTAEFVVPEDAALGPMVLEFPVERLALPAGRYLVAAVEPLGLTLALYNDSARFTANSTWVSWPTQPWTPVESFGATFAKPFRISALLAALVTQPVAENDAFAVGPAGTLAASVAGNDQLSDDGGNLFAQVSGVDIGTLQLAADGSFQYTAPAGFSGTTSFTYALCDIDADCDQATATIEVLPVVIFRDSFESN